MRMLVVALSMTLGLAGCGSGGGTPVSDLAPGDCFDDPPASASISEIKLVDCAEPHDNEVFADLAIEQTVYPGEDVIASLRWTHVRARSRHMWASRMPIPHSTTRSSPRPQNRGIR